MWYKALAQGYGLLSGNTPQTLIAYCIILNLIEAPSLHSFPTESVKIYRYKIFWVESFPLRTFLWLLSPLYTC